MARFEERNMLLVTVDDLCALRGVRPEAGRTLKACPPEGSAFCHLFSGHAIIMAGKKDARSTFFYLYSRGRTPD